MSAWLLSIVGVICLGILLEIVMPEGQTTKYVRGAFSLLVIFVVVAPLPKLLGGDYTLSLEGVSVDIDDSFIEATSTRYEEVGAADIEDYLLLNGYTATVNVVLKEGSLSQILRIEIKLTLSVLDFEDANTHITKVRELVCSRTGAEGNSIFITAITADDSEKKP